MGEEILLAWMGLNQMANPARRDEANEYDILHA